jgi:hypothetical protein
MDLWGGGAEVPDFGKSIAVGEGYWGYAISRDFGEFPGKGEEEA